MRIDNCYFDGPAGETKNRQSPACEPSTWVRVFPFFSPAVDSIQIIKQGDVRRGKLYYLRERSGKNTRIADKNRGDEQDLYELSENIEQKDESKVENEDIKKDTKDQDVSEEIKKTEETKTEETKTDESKVEVEKPNNESKP